VADVLFLFIIVAFFALMVAFVRVCERVVGTEEVIADSVEAPGSESTIPEEVLA
jgi:hypothetical protein